MRKLYVPLILFLLVVLEGVALDLLPEVIISGKSIIISHWVFVFLSLVAIFFDYQHTYFAVIYALIFGLLIDIVYTDVIGIYMFTYAAVIYIVHQIKRLFHANFHMTMIIVFIGLFSVDIAIYLLYSVIGKIALSWSDYLIFRLLPTILANLIFAMIIYIIFKDNLPKWSGLKTKNQMFNR